MTWRIYIVPVVGVGTRDDKRRAKYFSGSGISFGAMDYGLDPVMIVAADVTPEQHTTIAANADVLSAPEDIDATMTAGAVNAAQTFLELLNIPAEWINTSLTYRQTLRVVAGMFQFAQRWHGLGGGRIFASGVALTTRFDQLPLEARNRLVATAQSFNWDTSVLSGTNTLRQILKFVADQWGSAPFIIGGLTL